MENQKFKSHEEFMDYIRAKEFRQTIERVKEIEAINKKHQDKVKVWSKEMRERTIKANKYKKFISNYIYDSDDDTFIDD
jgi:hypothetical protein